MGLNQAACDHAIGLVVLLLAASPLSSQAFSLGSLAPVPTAPAVCGVGRGIARSQLLRRCRVVVASGSSNAVGGQNLVMAPGASDTEPQGPSPQDLQEWAQGRDVYYNDVPIEAARVARHGLGLAPVQTFFPQASRIIAIGDVHGDEGALIALLRMANCVDTEGNWCGGTTNVVQIGDILDRGDEERGCMDRLFELKQQAAAAGGAVHVLMGNHEAMNVDWDFDYVGLGGFDGWESLKEHHTKPASLFGNLLVGAICSERLCVVGDVWETVGEGGEGGATGGGGRGRVSVCVCVCVCARLICMSVHVCTQEGLTEGFNVAGVPRILKDRARAFTVGTGFAALMLSEMPLAIQIGDTVCVHGGLEMKHLEQGLHTINLEASEWLRGSAPRPALFDDEDGPIWNRAFSTPADRPLRSKDARRLEQVLVCCITWALGG